MDHNSFNKEQAVAVKASFHFLKKEEMKQS